MTEGERTRACCLHRGIDEHRVKKRSFAFALVYIKCFRTYSVYLSLRHGVFILYTPCHLPPQREARQLPPHATDLVHRGAKKRSKLPLCHPSTKNVTARRSHLNILPQSGKIFHTREAHISPRRRRDFTRRQAAVYHCGAKRRCAAPSPKIIPAHTRPHSADR